MDELFIRLSISGFGCMICLKYYGAIDFAYDISLIAASNGATGGGRGQMPQATLFWGRHFGEIVLLKQHSYIFIRCGLHEF